MNSAPWDDDYETAIADAKKKDVMRQAIARQSNASGRAHETLIIGACRYYLAKGIAYIVKEPEPFAVKRKDHKTLEFTGQFIKRAQPDFHGTLAGGHSIVFEAKYTDTKRMKRDVISKKQEDSLDKQGALGASVYVCVGIQNNCFMVPWQVFRNMKEIFGRQYVEAKDLEPWRVDNNGLIKFLNYVHKDEENVRKRISMQEGKH